MRADEAASLAIRPGKDGSLTPEVLRERWPAEVHGIGMPTSHVLEAQVCGGTIPMLRPRLEWDDLIDTLIEPEEGLCARRARFTEAHVVEHIAALGAGRLTVEAIEDLAEAFIDSERTVPWLTAPAAPRRSTPPSTTACWRNGSSTWWATSASRRSRPSRRAWSRRPSQPKRPASVPTRAAPSRPCAPPDRPSAP
jgi:hypothetical protein